TLHDALFTWIVLEMGIIGTSILYAILIIVGVSEETSLLLAFTILVGLILLGLLLAPKLFINRGQRLAAIEQQPVQSLESFPERQRLAALERLRGSLESFPERQRLAALERLVGSLGSFPEEQRLAALGRLVGSLGSFPEEQRFAALERLVGSL